MSDQDLQAISELLDKKLNPIQQRLDDIQSQVNDLKRQVMKSTAELKAMDSMILDEVERVHTLLDKHKQDENRHIVA